MKFFFFFFLWLAQVISLISWPKLVKPIFLYFQCIQSSVHTLGERSNLQPTLAAILDGHMLSPSNSVSKYKHHHVAESLTHVRVFHCTCKLGPERRTLSTFAILSITVTFRHQPYMRQANIHSFWVFQDDTICSLACSTHSAE